ncbi:MAG: MBL fold metallo-hydrolase [Theionarchaea archaeon]|nr:MBL fold metallo-hydrolase [Theionarchaea archaeon]
MTTIYTLIEDHSGYGTSLLGQHGVSFLIDHEGTKILFDTGCESEPLLHNMEKMHVDPGDIDCIFLSHCHYDHTGGLWGLLKAIGKRIPVIAHPTLFREHISLTPRIRSVGMKVSKDMMDPYADFLLTGDPFEITKDVFSTGEIISRTDFETHTLKVYTVKDGTLIRDPLMDDMSIAISTPDGVIVVSGCSHAGIVSILNHSLKITGTSEIKAVIGGLHLIDAEKERISKTIDSFKSLHVQKMYIGHCTGFKAESAFYNAFRDQFHTLYSGRIMKF